METESQREPPAAISLPGGQLTPDIVRVGNTVRRLPKGNKVALATQLAPVHMYGSVHFHLPVIRLLSSVTEIRFRLNPYSRLRRPDFPRRLR
jgi:hypothetical protein